MSDTFVCDACDERIDSGYTVSWTEDLKNSAAGVHWTRKGETTVNLCKDCWPQDHSATGRIRRLLGRLGFVTDGGDDGQ